MTGRVELMGMVLTSMPVNDYDRRITILTKERGRITAFAKGARRPTSAFLGCTQPFAFGTFSLFEGREAYNLVGADIQNYFSELRDDLSAIYYGMYFCELAGYVSRENQDATEALKLLYQTLRAVGKSTLDNRLVRAVYELRIVRIFGVMPNVFECSVCGEKLAEKTGPAYFSVEEGNCICSDCLSDMHGDFMESNVFEQAKYAESIGRIGLQPATVYAMQFILTAKIEKLYTFSLSEEILLELISLMKYYLQKHVGAKMRTEEMLSIME